MALRQASVTKTDPAPESEKKTESAPKVETKAAEPEVVEKEEIETEVSNPPAVQDSPSKAVAAAALADDGEDDGFGDLDDDIGFGSFPIVKLDGKTFESTEGHSFDSLNVVIIQSRLKALIKARKGEEDGIPIAFAYPPKECSASDVSPTSVLNMTAGDGTLISDHVKQWKEEGQMEGAHPIVSVYREVMARVVNPDGELDEELVILNIPPASRSRLAGYRKKLKLKGLNMSKVLTKLVPGPKIQKGQKSFHPWDFKLVGRIEE